MNRLDLWAALSEASTRVDELFHDWIAEGSPANRARVDGAVRVYIDQLGPVIGSELAFRYEASWTSLMHAIDRQTQYTAALSTRSTIDPTDVELAQSLAAEVEQAQAAFQEVGTATQALDSMRWWRKIRTGTDRRAERV